MSCGRHSIVGRAGFSTAILCAGLVIVTGVSPAFARVLVDVSHVGIPVAGSTDHIARGGDVVRTGAWAVVIVDVSIEGQPSFDGVLRMSQFDDDGDLCYDAVEVHLLADSGGSNRYYLYVPANPKEGRSLFSLELMDGEGEAVEVVCNGQLTTKPIPSQRPQPISDDHLLILEVSSSSIGRVLDLVQGDQTDLYDRPLVVGHLSALDLPELWIGLEIVDHIIWDEARPEELTPAQLAALVEWVHRGGTLVITASRTAGSLSMFPVLDEVLPVTLGEIGTSADLGTLRHKLLGTPEEGPYRTSIPVVRASVRDEAQVIIREESVGDVLTRMRVGRGCVIFSAVALRDLFKEEGSPTQFFRKILSLKTRDQTDVSISSKSLFNHVISAVGFATKGGVYLLIAVLSSVAYVGIATFGSWAVLSSKGLKHHSWGVFGLVVSATAVLSIVAVKAVLGIETKLHQISIVDAVADEPFGYATAFFGLKTPWDTKLDLWLPSDAITDIKPGPTRCYLLPSPVPSVYEGSGPYADPGEYRLVPASAVMEGVRFRATLKRLAGRWEGPLGGRVTGRITTRKYGGGALDWRMTPDSYVVNDLGADLRNCYIIHTVLDVYDANSSIGLLSDRGDYIYAYPIGDVPSDGSKVRLYERCYGDLDDTEKVYERMGEYTLAKMQDKRWDKPYRGLLRTIYTGEEETRVTSGSEQEALLLLSTLGEYNVFRSASEREYMMGLNTFAHDRLRQLDLREQFRRDCVYLIGFAAEPGPVRLATRRGDRPFRTVTPDERKSWTMYRIRIPVNTARQVDGKDRDGA